MGELLRFNDHLLPDSFVSIAVSIGHESKTPKHAAILIRHNNINYLHHFPGANKKPEVIEQFEESGWFIYKIIDRFKPNDSSEIESFLHYCKKICEKSNITYSFIADGSTYDADGTYISKSGLPEFGTCVGFCINTLANTIIDLEGTVINLDDWDDNEVLDVNEWGMKAADKNHPDLDWNLYDAFTKRITPLEYLCISYFDNFPINRKDINEIKATVNSEINQIYQI